VESAKVTVVENGSEIVNMLNRERLSSFSTHHNPSEPVTVIYIGAFEPWHGITILIRAVAKAIAQRVLIRLVLVGAGTELDKIKQLVSELSLERWVALTGHLTAPDFARYLAEAEIGVSPYCGRVEYSGLKLFDYKAAGLATIASGENGQPAVSRR
jgi:glycosyltransferase involved in cell wall biosynthesis